MLRKKNQRDGTAAPAGGMSIRTSRKNPLNRPRIPLRGVRSASWWPCWPSQRTCGLCYQQGVMQSYSRQRRSLEDHQIGQCSPPVGWLYCHCRSENWRLDGQEPGWDSPFNPWLALPPKGPRFARNTHTVNAV